MTDKMPRIVYILVSLLFAVLLALQLSGWKKETNVIIVAGSIIVIVAYLVAYYKNNMTPALLILVIIGFIMVLAPSITGIGQPADPLDAVKCTNLASFSNTNLYACEYNQTQTIIYAPDYDTARVYMFYGNITLTTLKVESSQES
jgi:lysylphosphatidylglycerol synthetase-like protein (DUF2156 family)